MTGTSVRLVSYEYDRTPVMRRIPLIRLDDARGVLDESFSSKRPFACLVLMMVIQLESNVLFI